MTSQQILILVLGIIATIVSSMAVAIALGAFKFAWDSNGIQKTMAVKLGILFDAYEREVAAALLIIHKPHEEAKELDSLLDKLKTSMQKFFQHAISDEELIELARKLEDINNNNEIQPGERLAAAKVLGYIEMRCKMMQLGL